MKTTMLDSINFNATAQYLLLIMCGLTLVSALISPFFIIVGILIYIRKKLSADLPSEYRKYLESLRKTMYFALVIYIVMFSMPIFLLMIPVDNKKLIEYLIEYGQEVTSLFLIIASIYHFRLLKKTTSNISIS